MSEEELKAIWYFQEISDNKYDTENWYIVENLIDRLQKELEQEKEKNKELEKNNKIIAQIYRDDLPKDTEYIIITKPNFERIYKLEYISVDKIRNKIKELEEIEQKDSVINENGVCCVPAYWLAKLQKEVLEDLIKEK